MAREKIPNRRRSDVLEFVWQSPSGSAFAYTVSCGFYTDGRLAEVFIDSDSKTGSQIRDIGHDSAILISLALQHGVPLDRMVKAVAREEDGRPASPVGAALEVVAGMVGEWSAAIEREAAPMQRLSGGPCAKCGNYLLVRSGTCMTCQACGETTGCS